MNPKPWNVLIADDQREIIRVFLSVVGDGGKLKTFEWGRVDEPPPEGMEQSPWRGFKGGKVVLTAPAWRSVTYAQLKAHAEKEEEASIEVRISPRAAKLLVGLLQKEAVRLNKVAGQMIQEHNAEKCTEEAKFARDLADSLGVGVMKHNQKNPPWSHPE
jgi:hypothetical protein